MDRLCFISRNSNETHRRAGFEHMADESGLGGMFVITFFLYRISVADDGRRTSLDMAVAQWFRWLFFGGLVFVQQLLGDRFPFRSAVHDVGSGIHRFFRLGDDRPDVVVVYVACHADHAIGNRCGRDRQERHGGGSSRHVEGRVIGHRRGLRTGTGTSDEQDWPGPFHCEHRGHRAVGHGFRFTVCQQSDSLYRRSDLLYGVADGESCPTRTRSTPFTWQYASRQESDDSVMRDVGFGSVPWRRAFVGSGAVYSSWHRIHHYGDHTDTDTAAFALVVRPAYNDACHRGSIDFVCGRIVVFHGVR